jgi:hypothetical protein
MMKWIKSSLWILATAAYTSSWWIAAICSGWTWVIPVAATIIIAAAVFASVLPDIPIG